MHFITVEIIKEIPNKKHWKKGQEVTITKDYAHDLLKKKYVKLKTNSEVVKSRKGLIKDEEE